MRVLLLSAAVLVTGWVLMAYASSGVVSVAQQHDTPELVADVFSVPELSASAWGIYDTEREMLIAGSNVHDVRPVASLVKLMTARVARDRLQPDDRITVSARAVATEGRAGRLEAGQELSAHELVFPLLIESSNDASEALAEQVGREEFLAALDEAAAALAMRDTVYADPSGLSPGNYSTVADTATLMHHLVRHEPHILDITRLSRYIGTQHTWINVNPVSSVAAFRGGKHGYTHAAGRTLAGVFQWELADGNTHHITLILLGSDDLVADTERMQAFVREHIAYR